MDQTEARYAEIARLMYETGNWVVLQIDYGEPFWAKPPLSTWAAASSLSLFGVSEFSIRLPYFLVCAGIALGLGRYCNHSNPSYFLPACILLTMPEFYLHAGVVSTDVFLLLSTVIVMLSFWESMQENAAPFWGYLFFLGMGLGVLAKGPIIGILTLPPIVFWSWKTKQFSKAIKRAPWFVGLLVFIFTCLPWYYLTEERSPGFIDYFIVGEHFNRYFNSEWKGDKYGFPKQQPLGIVWGFFLAFTLPWWIAALQWMRQHWRLLKTDPWVLFLLAWMLWPLLFFTASKSLIHPYILPSVVPLTLLLAYGWHQIKNIHWYLNIGLAVPLLLIGFYSTRTVDTVIKDNTDKYLIAEVNQHPCYSLNHKSYSSQFYTGGTVEKIDTQRLSTLRQAEQPFYILIRHKDTLRISSQMRNELTPVIENKKKALYKYRKKGLD